MRRPRLVEERATTACGQEGAGALATTEGSRDLTLVRTLAAVAAALTIEVSPASAHPGYPPAFLTGDRCIHRAEVGLTGYPLGAAWHLRWHDKDNPASRGGEQFLWSTWARLVARHRLLGYPVDPADASRAQQEYVAFLLWRDDGDSFHEWSTASGCGLS